MKTNLLKPRMLRCMTIHVILVFLCSIIMTSCNNDGNESVIDVDEQFIQIVENSITPFSVCLSLSSYIYETNKIYISANKEKIEAIASQVKHDPDSWSNAEYYLTDSTDIIGISIDEVTHNYHINCVYGLCEDTDYYYIAVSLSPYSDESIRVQSIQTFKTTYIKPLVDIGGSVLWDGYNYMNGKSVENFYDAINPPLFYKNELPSPTDSNFRYPTKEELMELDEFCDLVYFDPSYKFVKLKSKLTQEELYLPYTLWNPHGKYGSLNLYGLYDACFFPSEGGEYGLKYGEKSNNVSDVGFYLSEYQFYAWNASVDGETVKGESRRGVRFVMDKR